MNKQEKKLKTVSTSVKEENVEITQVTANGNVVIHPVTKAQNVKYKNSNLNDVLENKIALDGDGGQNFNFIENKVVQDGLNSDVFVNNQNDFTILSKRVFITVGTSNTTLYKQGVSSTSGFEVILKPTGIIVLAMFNNGTYSSTDVTGLKITTGIYDIMIFRKNNILYFRFNDNLATVENITGIGSSSSKLSAYQQNTITYSRLLTPAEIQHNFSVLNNPPSIKELHTTDSTGKTSILKLSSDEDHVEMASGRTLREEYMGVLKAMGKEVPSVDGSHVEVPNGIEARVISGEIKGHTVKNYLHDFKDWNIKSLDEKGRLVLTTGYGKCNFSYQVLAPDTEYDIVAYVSKNTLDKQLALINSYNSVFKSSKILNLQEVGLVKATLTTKTDISTVNNVLVGSNDTTRVGEIVIDWLVIVEKGVGQFINSYIPFGLSSTEAIIANNGQQYPIYATQEDKVNKKVISLSKVGDVADSISLQENGSGVLSHYIVDGILNGDQDWKISGAVGTTSTVFFTDYFNDVKRGTNSTIIISSNKFQSRTGLGCADGDEGIFNTSTAVGRLYIRVLNDKATTPTELKNYFLNNPERIEYITEYPTTVHIPKELVPTILTHNQTNILEAGGAVKPSSFKVTVPVDRIAEIEARLQALESTTVDVVLNK